MAAIEARIRRIKGLCSGKCVSNSANEGEIAVAQSGDSSAASQPTEENEVETWAVEKERRNDGGETDQEAEGEEENTEIDVAEDDGSVEIKFDKDQNKAVEMSETTTVEDREVVSSNAREDVGENEEGSEGFLLEAPGEGGDCRKIGSEPYGNKFRSSVNDGKLLEINLSSDGEYCADGVLCEAPILANMKIPTDPMEVCQTVFGKGSFATALPRSWVQVAASRGDQRAISGGVRLNHRCGSGNKPTKLHHLEQQPQKG
ncbi:hypothetical protein U1Q18_009873 [Sarracenia purpurea var. burkii]